MSNFFHPKLQAVEALAPYRLRTTWGTGEVLEVDVESVLRGIPALANLLDPKIFAKHTSANGAMASNGSMLSWEPTTSMRGPKKQAGEVSHQMFDIWMHRNGLSLNTAAEALGLSRRI